MSSLQALAQHTTIVADTGDLDAIKRLRPTSATTNPSLISQAFLSGNNDKLLNQVKGLTLEDAIDTLTVLLGKEILAHIDGQVSTEVDASLSFDTDATIKKAYKLIELYEKLGIDKARILIKIAATWQGIKAAERLEKEGIGCNLTLLFSEIQAYACADAGVTLISPFVGRITDWQKKHEQKDYIKPHDDLGVQSVKNIYHHYKKHGYHTYIMGASFRTPEQILALAGCDLLTISPALLDVLSQMAVPVPRMLLPHTMPISAPFALCADDFKKTQDTHPLNELLINGIQGFIKAKEELGHYLNKQL